MIKHLNYPVGIFFLYHNVWADIQNNLSYEYGRNKGLLFQATLCSTRHGQTIYSLTEDNFYPSSC